MHEDIKNLVNETNQFISNDNIFAISDNNTNKTCLFSNIISISSTISDKDKVREEIEEEDEEEEEKGGEKKIDEKKEKKKSNIGNKDVFTDNIRSSGDNGNNGDNWRRYSNIIDNQLNLNSITLNDVKPSTSKHQPVAFLKKFLNFYIVFCSIQ